MLLQGKVVLITGAGSGIGRGTALAVAEEGADVVATDLDLPSVQETRAAVEPLGRRVLALPLDVTDTAAVDEVWGKALGDFGRLDGLVNSAGILAMASGLEADEVGWERQFQVNTRALFSCCQRFARALVELGRGGAIVNVASNAGKVGYPNMAAYNASKAAVVSLTRSLAAEWASHSINVNAVCPGGVETPMLGDVARWIGEKEGLDPAQLLPQMVPAQLGRHVQPLEVGRVVAFLLSDRAAIIRGQSINVDGGDTPY